MGEILMVSTIVENSRGLLIDTVATDSEVAKKAGNNTQTFKVADAVNPDEAMALGQLTKANIDQLLIDANTVDGVQGALLGIGGAGYSWVDEIANRVGNVTYTNSTGKPIQVVVDARDSAGVHVTFNIDNIILKEGAQSITGYFHFNVIVPHNSTYKLNIVPGALDAWAELK